MLYKHQIKKTRCLQWKRKDQARQARIFDVGELHRTGSYKYIQSFEMYSREKVRGFSLEWGEPGAESFG